MYRLLYALLICIFVITGASPLRACYVTRPDCPSRGRVGCPLAAAMEEPPAATTGCPFSGMVAGDDTPLPRSPERLKRLQVEQIQPMAPELPIFVPVLGFGLLFTPQGGTAGPIQRPCRLAFPLRHRPPPLFLVQQSFLI